MVILSVNYFRCINKITHLSVPILFTLFILTSIFSAVQAQQVNITKDIRYADAPPANYKDISSDRLLDLYLPDNSGERPLKTLIFVHGGGFVMGDKESTEEICTEIAKQGFAVVSINYRLYLKMREGRSNWRAFASINNMDEGVPIDGKFHPELQKAVEIASEDLVLAMDWVKKNASKYGFNGQNIAVSGSSAGSMTVLHTVYVSPPKNLPIKAVINLWGGVQNTAAIQAQKKLPALLTFHGYQDRVISVEYAYALEKRMRELGNRKTETHILKVKGHALNALVAKEKVNEIADFLNRNL